MTNHRRPSWMPSPWCGATCGWRRRVFHRPPPATICRNSPPPCTTEWWTPSLTPLEMRKAQQQAALDAPLTPVGGIGAGFPHPEAIWSWPRPCSTSSSPDLSVRRSVPVPPATVPGIPQRPPIPESAGAPWSRNRCPWRPALSTDSWCAAHRRCHRRRCGREPGPSAVKPMSVHMLGDQGLQHFPEFVGNLETAGGGIGLVRFGHGPCLGPTLNCLPVTALPVSTSYWDRHLVLQRRVMEVSRKRGDRGRPGVSGGNVGPLSLRSWTSASHPSSSSGPNRSLGKSSRTTRYTWGRVI